MENQIETCRERERMCIFEIKRSRGNTNQRCTYMEKVYQKPDIVENLYGLGFYDLFKFFKISS
jgi:hypothetical protein